MAIDECSRDNFRLPSGALTKGLTSEGVMPTQRADRVVVEDFLWPLDTPLTIATRLTSVRVR